MMKDLDQHILSAIQSKLGDEHLARTIIYLDPKPFHTGEKVQVGDVSIDMPWDGFVAFVDLEPGVNWSHACSYLAIRQDSSEVIQVPAQMPPFLKANQSHFRLLWRGPLAPEWAVETTEK